MIQGLAHRRLVVCTCTYYNSEVEILRTKGGLGSILESDLIGYHMLAILALVVPKPADKEFRPVHEGYLRC